MTAKIIKGTEVRDKILVEIEAEVNDIKDTSLLGHLL